MTKIVKFAILPLTGMVVMVAALAAYVVATFDPNQYKPQIVQAVKDRTGRTLNLDGNITLSLFPSLGISLGRASLSEHASDREFAGADDLRVTLKLMPLLSKQVVVDSIEVKGLRANLVRYKDGKTNIDELTGRGDKSAAPEGGKPQVKIDIDHLAVEGATITYTDEARGITFALSKLNLKSGRLATGVPSKIDLSFTVQSDKPRLNLETTLKTTVSFDLDKQNYALIGLDLSTNGIAAGISHLGATVKGNVDAKLASEEVLVSKLAIEAAGKQENGDLKVKLDIPKLTVSKDNVSGEKIALETTLNQAKSKIVARLDIPGIDGNAQSFKAGGLTVSLELQKGGATIKARLTSPLAGSVEAQKIELAKLAATVNVDNRKLPKNPLTVAIKGSALIDLARRNASLTFAAKFDDSSANGKASLARFAPPFFTFDCNIDQLDASRYLPQPDPTQKQPEQLLDLSALKGLNASGSVKIGSLKVSNVNASNVRVDVKAND